MLARRPLPPEYAAWNRRWGAPYGRTGAAARILTRLGLGANQRFLRLRGPFAIQPNNDTRRFEYPWAYAVTPLAPGMRVLEVGGGLAGFQFVLAREGLHVVNVDPGLEATGTGWPCDAESIARLNRAFGTSVELRNTTLDRAELPDDSFDRVFSISAIEHIPPAEIPGLARDIRRVLRPGGSLVLTVDLFLDVEPFTTRTENVYGRNIDLHELVEHLDLDLVVGDPRELHGFPDFDPERVLADLATLVYGAGYPACVQLLVLRKPAP